MTTWFMRVLILIRCFMAAVMAANAKEALDSRSSAGFGAAYAGMHIVLVLQYVRARTHELAHVAYYAKGNRLRLFGLIRLASKGFRERFEKRADLETLRRGYAQGLKQYRLWLYQHVTGGALNEKKRDYLTPEEIDAIQPG